MNLNIRLFNFKWLYFNVNFFNNFNLCFFCRMIIWRFRLKLVINIDLMLFKSILIDFFLIYIKFLIGFFFKKNQLLLFFRSYNILYFIKLLKLNSFFFVDMILDIFVIDLNFLINFYDKLKNCRFELTYCFLNIQFKKRIFIRTIINENIGILSLTKIFFSSN